MKLKRFFVFAIVVLLAFGVTACNRSASQGPGSSTSPQGTPAMPNPNALNNEFMTQTAVAQQSGEQGNVQPAIPTAIPTNTPIPQVEPTTVPTQAPTPLPQPSPTPGIPGQYVLQKGEFPYCIARRFNINPDELLAANNLSKNVQSFPGQTLVIPKGAKPFPGKRALLPHPASYTVKSGDTIYTIACTFGDVDPAAIVAANNLKAPYTLTVGQTLNVP